MRNHRVTSVDSLRCAGGPSDATCSSPHSSPESPAAFLRRIVGIPLALRIVIERIGLTRLGGLVPWENGKNRLATRHDCGGRDGRARDDGGRLRLHVRGARLPAAAISKPMTARGTKVSCSPTGRHSISTSSPAIVDSNGGRHRSTTFNRGSRRSARDADHRADHHGTRIARIITGRDRADRATRCIRGRDRTDRSRRVSRGRHRESGATQSTRCVLGALSRAALPMPLAGRPAGDATGLGRHSANILLHLRFRIFVVE